MRKQRSIVAAAILFAACSVHPFALQDATKIEMPTMTETAAKSRNTGLVTDIVNGKYEKAAEETMGYYVINDHGDIFLADGSGNLFANGAADDQFIYDEEGRQINSLSYIGEKYRPIFEATPEDGNLVFDNETEAALFTIWHQLEICDRQGLEIWHQDTDHGKVVIPKANFLPSASQENPIYHDTIASLATQISMKVTEEEKIRAAMELVSGTFEYDSAYQSANMTEALQAGKGVCYHYARLAKETLEAAGIPAEYITGHLSADKSQLHVWIKAWDREKEVWRYLDPTVLDSDPISAWLAFDLYSMYLNMYNATNIENSAFRFV